MSLALTVHALCELHLSPVPVCVYVEGRSEMKLSVKHTEQLSSEGVPRTDTKSMYEVKDGFEIEAKVNSSFLFVSCL